MPRSKKAVGTSKRHVHTGKKKTHDPKKFKISRQNGKHRVIPKPMPRKAGHKTAKSREVKQVPASDLEQLLVDRMARNYPKLDVPRKALFIPEIIYASTPSFRELAYSNGFSMGRMLYERSDKTMDALLSTLEQAGLGKVLYHLFEESAVITTGPDISQPNINEAIHTYEAGIIAGFICASNGRTLSVIETHCIYNGNEMCQFKIGGIGQPYINEKYIKPEEMLDSILSSIRNKSRNGRISEEYYLSYMLPLSSQPISDEVSKLMYIVGKNFEKGAKIIDNETMNMVKMSFGLKSAKMSGSSKPSIPKTITVEYSALNSNSQFLSLSQSFLHGMVEGMEKVSATSRVVLGRSNNYILYIYLTPSKVISSKLVR